MTSVEYRIPPGWIHDGRTSPEDLAMILNSFFRELDKAFPVKEEIEESEYGTAVSQHQHGEASG